MSHSHSKRRDTDVMKLMMAKYRVTLADGGTNPHDFYVKFHGPNDSNYSGGIWKIHVILPTEYPYKSPSIGFCNKIFHPNIDEPSGSVCLDVINQTWSPMYDLVNVFSVFLPQLLLYPNPSDPLNPHAAMMMLKENTNYEKTIKEYVKKYASVDFVMEDDDEEDEEEEQEEQKKEKVKEDNNNNKMKTEIINTTGSSNNNTTTTTNNNNNTIHSNSPSMDSSSLSPTVTTHPSLSMSDDDDQINDFDEFQLMEIEDEVFSDIDEMPLETETITV